MPRKDITDEIVCRAYLERELHGGFVDEILQKLTGEPPKVCNAAMERADRHGLVEYGTSLRGGWLTDKGRELIQI